MLVHALPGHADNEQVPPRAAPALTLRTSAAAHLAQPAAPHLLREIVLEVQARQRDGVGVKVVPPHILQQRAPLRQHRLQSPAYKAQSAFPTSWSSVGGLELQCLQAVTLFADLLLLSRWFVCATNTPQLAGMISACSAGGLGAHRGTPKSTCAFRQSCS